MPINITPALVGSAVALIDELFTTEEERAVAKLKLVELQSQSALAQLSVNAQEAKHSSIFVSGWRPAVGWTCLTAMALSFIVFPIAHSVAVYYTAFTGEHVDLSGLPELDWATLGPVIMGMLGLGGLRTAEKWQGVARN